MGALVIQQQISAGNQFDGQAPSTTPARGNDLWKDYPEDSQGGLFDFELEDPALIVNVTLKLDGNTSAWSLNLVDVDGDEVTLFSGTNETSFVTTYGDRVLITQGQKLKLTTTGATGALKARVAVGG